MPAPRKNSGDRRLSAAIQHRKLSGEFERTQSEKLHAQLLSDRKLGRAARMPTPAEAAEELKERTTKEMLASVSLGLVTIVAALIVCYAVVVTAIANGMGVDN
ncbi:TPA: hypothetical protein N0F65_005895 [Lagenidium giganteum]|uniref:Uncharacterized protein n=1 Tax=Lagenidium giganteum TaxID=4803 RepID=A0AAV2ZCF0_9STRA|nr:TPA: hypothetical protein N0F65_005895 [Lagenidium giganteum]